MFTYNFFTYSQEQLNESQQKFLESCYEYQKQVSELQKKLLTTWVDMAPNGQTQPNFTETWQKSVNFQQECLNSLFDAQKMAANLTIDTQKQFWNNYFQMTKNIVKEKA